ncbi:MAG: HAD-IA family hydrolase [Leptospirales bacterium]
MDEKIELIIYDWDGTLMDSIGLISQCMQKAFSELALPELSDEKAKSIIGLALVRGIEVLTPGASVALREKVVLTYKKYFFKLSETGMHLFPGVAKGMSQLKANGVGLAVATGKSRMGLDRDFARIDFADFFHETRTIDECRPKPDPHMIEDIMQTLKVDPDKTIMVGDTSYDMEMAERAGIRRIAASYGAHPVEQLTPFKPEKVFSDFQTLHEWLLSRVGDNSSNSDHARV